MGWWQSRRSKQQQPSAPPLWGEEGDYGGQGDYSSLHQVTNDLVEAGLVSSNLIVGIDFTKSNEWTGKKSFNGRSLHHISSTPNLYEQVISIIGRTLPLFGEDNSIHCFGFGDESTRDQGVFCFYPDGRPCNGFSEALGRYRELVPHVRLAAPTSFAPIIEMAMTIVEQNGGQHHTLLIIADGQVTRSVDTASGQLSAQEQKTVEAIAEASGFPLSIVLVGVGDEMVQELDDKIPSRAFNNFHIVKFSEIMSENMIQSMKEATFALSALMQIPEQYEAIVRLGIVGPRSARSTYRPPLLPPPGDQYPYSSERVSATVPGSSSFSSPREGPMHMPASTHDNEVCSICYVSPEDMEFGCGHRICCVCGLRDEVEVCPFCRAPINSRIMLY